jgi:hypothetical protein
MPLSNVDSSQAIADEVSTEAGLELAYFDEPTPTADGPPPKASGYRRVPWFLVMEWLDMALGNIRKRTESVEAGAGAARLRLPNRYDVVSLDQRPRGD